ncbi:MAG TPA: hypothetical protein VMH40_10600 [Myxococcaceae bacterium]|nr:hypothetical protein [Myxococcaceae bacterium]
MPTCAVVLVLLQLGAVLHLAASPHGICPEHGLAVELDAASTGAEAFAAAALPGVGCAPVATFRSDAHPHCPSLWVLRQARSEVVGSAAALVRPELATVALAPDAVTEPQPSTLHRAPKEPPPA